MKAFIAPLMELAEFESVYKRRKEKKGILQFSGCVTSQKTHMMYALSGGFPYKVIACSSESKARQIYEEYKFLSNETYLYPAKDLLFYQADIRSKELVKQRMEVIEAILSGRAVTVVTSFDGFMDSLLPKEIIKSKVIYIDAEDSVDMEEYLEELAVQWKKSYSGLLMAEIQKEKEMCRISEYQNKLKERVDFLKDAYREMIH